MTRQGLRWGAVALGAVMAEPAAAAPEGFCVDYVRNAVFQFQRARATPGCWKRAGNRWHQDRERHMSWCLSASVPAVNREVRSRDLQISACDPSYGD